MQKRIEIKQLSWCRHHINSWKFVSVQQNVFLDDKRTGNVLSLTDQRFDSNKQTLCLLYADDSFIFKSFWKALIPSLNCITMTRRHKSQCKTCQMFIRWKVFLSWTSVFCGRNRIRWIENSSNYTFRDPQVRSHSRMDSYNEFFSEVHRGFCHRCRSAYELDQQNQPLLLTMHRSGVRRSWKGDFRRHLCKPIGIVINLRKSNALAVKVGAILITSQKIEEIE